MCPCKGCSIFHHPLVPFDWSASRSRKSGNNVIMLLFFPHFCHTMTNVWAACPEGDGDGGRRKTSTIEEKGIHAHKKVSYKSVVNNLGEGYTADIPLFPKRDTEAADDDDGNNMLRGSLNGTLFKIWAVFPRLSARDSIWRVGVLMDLQWVGSARMETALGRVRDYLRV